MLLISTYGHILNLYTGIGAGESGKTFLDIIVFGLISEGNWLDWMNRNRYRIFSDSLWIL